MLGVAKDCDQAQIKKSFLILAKKYHPDVNKSNDAVRRFSEINEAYQTLETEEKRNMYDMTGLTANEQDNVEDQFNSGSFGFDPFSKVKRESTLEREFEELEKEFKEFFNMDFAKSSFSSGDGGTIKGRDINGKMKLTFEESYTGCVKGYPLMKYVQCIDCNGTGLAN